MIVSEKCQQYQLEFVLIITTIARNFQLIRLASPYQNLKKCNREKKEGFSSVLRRN